MSHNSVDTLVKMANQIGQFFSAQKSGDQAASAAEHLSKFWDPRMRAGIIDHVAKGGEGLNPTALEAVKRLTRPGGYRGSTMRSHGEDG
jgi:formate dehydrogenase subunit delta